MSSIAHAGLIPPAVGVLNYRFCSIWVQEFSGTAFGAPPSRVFKSVAFHVETDADVSAGELIPVILRPDGSWAKSSIAAITLGASGLYEGVLSDTLGPM